MPDCIVQDKQTIYIVDSHDGIRRAYLSMVDACDAHRAKVEDGATVSIYGCALYVGETVCSPDEETSPMPQCRVTTDDLLNQLRIYGPKTLDDLTVGLYGDFGRTGNNRATVASMIAKALSRGDLIESEEDGVKYYSIQTINRPCAERFAQAIAKFGPTRIDDRVARYVYGDDDRKARSKAASLAYVALNKGLVQRVGDSRPFVYSVA